MRRAGGRRARGRWPIALQRLLVANRGEVAIRVLRAAAELGVPTVAVYSEDDARSLHVARADRAHALAGRGPAAYLDVEGIAGAALAAGCDAVHPGYGFLAESAALARRCADAGLVFVGPDADALDLLGDKARARVHAARCGVPILRGTPGPASLEDARAFLAALPAGGAMVIKAIAGGGGRGMRVVRAGDDVAEAYARCRSEAKAAFGHDGVYAEELLPRARHVEVQVLGDGAAVSHLWERECSLQRRHQKLVEIAPSPALAPALRARLLDAALAMARALGYRSLGTFEFLVDADPRREPGFAFLEANPRLQVEHGVSEAVTGVDLVRVQLELAAGRTLAELGLAPDAVPPARGVAVEARVLAERLGDDGAPRPAGGTLRAFEPPAGPGLRVDGCGYAGYAINPRFDPLLAKVIAHAPSGGLPDALARARRALAEFRIEGVPTNLAFLQRLLAHPDVVAGRVHTRFVEERLAELVASGAPAPRLWFEDDAPEPAAADAGGATAAAARAERAALAGARVDPVDPLAVLAYGKGLAAASTADAGARVPGARAGAGPASEARAAVPGPSPARERRVGPAGADPGADADAGAPGRFAVRAPLQGTVVSLDAAVGQGVRAGAAVAVLEAMKMEHVVRAARSGVVRAWACAPGDAVPEGHPLLWLEEAALGAAEDEGAAEVDLDAVRPDLAEVIERHAVGLDARRPGAVARRRKTGQRTARENVEDLLDPGSFVEIGALVVAAQRRRRPLQELIERTPADGLVGGLGRVNGQLFPDERARCAVASYDYTVLAGTQGQQNHRKKDRLFELAEALRLPFVIFTEGGGGRPGDSDGLGVAGLDCLAFRWFARLSGLVPLVAINSGRCFAGNAALLGCADVVIAARGSNIGMGGPAMIEGGGLGVFRPEDVGPMEVQVPNGVVDVPVEDEAEAVRVAKQYLAYFQGPLADWTCADPRRLRAAIPENRLRVYDVRAVIELLADTGSVLELRRAFGRGMVTALARIEGRPLGIVANDPMHLAGAIDADGADKAARFMQLCDAFDLPLLFLCDTPGIMVGPEAERTALVRHAARMFVVGASLTVPFFTIVLRKGYGLGAQAMAGGSFKAPLFCVAWPTAEFGGMGLEGAVKLGFRNELAAIADPAERRAAFEQMVRRMYEHGKAVNVASHFEIDDVIDPAESRRRVVEALRAVPPPAPRTGKKRPCVDAW